MKDNYLRKVQYNEIYQKENAGIIEKIRTKFYNIVANLYKN